MEFTEHDRKTAENLQKTPTVAYFDSGHEFPVEILHAAGITPIKLFGNVSLPSDTANQYLSNFFCPLARSIFEEALQNAQQYDGIIISHGCDSTNRHFDVWKHHISGPFLYWLYHPMKNTRPAERFFQKEVQQMILYLETHLNLHISEENLKRALHQANIIKNQLQKLANVRGVKNTTNCEYFDILQRALTLPFAELQPYLVKIEAEWQNREPLPAYKKRIFLTGTDITYPEFWELLDHLNLMIVRDDLNIGERMFATRFDETISPLDALTKYYLNTPRNATKLHLHDRTAYIMETIQNTSVQGILSQNLKFCEPYAIDSVAVNDVLRTSKIPLMHIEREFSANFDAQLLTRLEAFGELLE